MIDKLMITSDNGIKLIKEVEGFKNYAYLDSGGAPTIGVGHLLTKAERMSGKIVINGLPTKYAMGLSAQQILDLLRRDLSSAEKCVNDNVKIGLAQNQFDALVSFTFNVGNTSFSNSTLLKLLNNGKYNEIPAQLMRWVYDNGKKVEGLENRRKKEVNMWQGTY